MDICGTGRVQTERMGTALQLVVDTSAAVAGTSARGGKISLIADVLRAVAPEDLEVTATYLAGGIRQRRTGVDWGTLRTLPAPSPTASLTVRDLDTALEHLAGLSGPGSATARRSAVDAVFSSATAAEQRWLVSVLADGVRQGALDAVLIEAAAKAAGVAVAEVRRAAMLAGSPATATAIALTAGVEGLRAVGLEVGRPVLPMLAGSAPDVAAAMEKAGGGTVAVDAKLDGIRLQAHRDGDTVALFTRGLQDITDRLPETAALVRSLPVTSCVLDGEAMTLGPDGRPRPFQETAARTASGTGMDVTALFFDALQIDGRDLLDTPGSERFAELARIVPESHQVRRLITADAVEAEAFLTATLAAGHEGVVVKDLQAGYAAGRRGSSWVKVKPIHTLDLVVLAVERGSGRRAGTLSNIHLGARDADGGFVMLGKTFKGMTDAMLAWQTERFRELEVSDDGWTVTVRPEQVVEIAFDGVQRSSRYPGGVTLRFARVVRYRDDKPAAEADTLDAVRAFSPSR